MKIGFVFDDSLDKNDGIQQYMFALRDWFTKQGHEVHFLVGQTARGDVAHVHSMSRNVAVQFNGNRLSIPLFVRRRLARQVVGQDFDVLHVQVPYHPLMAGRIIKVAPKQTVVFGTFHIAPYSRLVTIGNWFLGKWSAGSLKRFDDLISVSPAAADFCKKTFGRTTDIIPNVIDYQHFHTAQPLPAYNDSKKTIVFLGRLVPRKGCQLLLSAINTMQQLSDLPDYRVVICGAGPLETNLKAYVAQHNLQDRVSFVGRISELEKPSYLAAADIAVFPSSGGESFGIVLAEAMASGRAAVLGGDNPGYRSVLGERPDLLFDPHNAQALADALVFMLQNEPARQAAAAWGMRHTEQYDVALVGQQLLDRYRRVAKSNHNR